MGLVTMRAFDHTRLFMALALACVAGLANIGCTSEVESTDFTEASAEPVGQVSQGIWEDECWWYNPDYIGEYRIDHTSNTTYDKEGCNKTWIAQVNDFDMPSSWFIGTVVLDKGPRPTTRAACEDLWMAAQLAEATGSSFHLLTSDGDSNYRSRGRWEDGECKLPLVWFLAPLFDDGGLYRVFATSRTSRHGSTRKMRFLTFALPF